MAFKKGDIIKSRSDGYGLVVSVNTFFSEDYINDPNAVTFMGLSYDVYTERATHEELRSLAKRGKFDRGSWYRNYRTITCRSLEIGNDLPYDYRFWSRHGHEIEYVCSTEPSAHEYISECLLSNKPLDLKRLVEIDGKFNPDNRTNQ